MNDDTNSPNLNGLSEPPRRFAVRDAAGRLQATLVRNADKTMWWRDALGIPGLGRLHAADLLYGVERLRRVPLDVPIVVTEGPKDCEACWRARLVAVATLTGAGGVPTAAALAPLRDRIVVLWPDADAGGAEHMRRVTEALVDIAREIRVVDVTGLPPKAGAADLTPEAIARRVARARAVRA